MHPEVAQILQDARKAREKRVEKAQARTVADAVQIITAEAIEEIGIEGFLEDFKTADDMIKVHDTVGRYIRNEFGMWDEQSMSGNAIRGDAAKNYHCPEDDPDEISHLILTEVWKAINAKKNEKA